MSITVDYSRPFRSHARRIELVEAVLAAEAEDEGDWLEWKGEVDLTSAAGQFKLARALLSMANRSVAGASRYAGGTGYVIFGASHRGQLPGVTPMDGAELAQRMESWLGSPAAMVEWDVNYVERDGQSVLVVTVEPPVVGQRIAALHKQYEQARKGSIFVRKGTRSEHADPADLRMLEERLLAGQRESADLKLEVAASVEPRFIRYDFGDEPPVVWLAQRRQSLQSPPRSRGMAIGEPLQYMMESIEDHLERCSDALLDACAGELARMTRNQLHLIVTNPADETVRGAELVLELPEDWAAFQDVADAEMPGPERQLRTTFLRSSSALQRVHRADPGEASISDDGRTVTFVLGDVRPKRSVSCEPLTLATNGLNPDPHQVAHWSATSIERRGVEEGSMPLVLGAESMSLRALIGNP